MSVVISKPWRFFISISCFLLFASGCSNTGSTITPIAENGLTQSAPTLAPQSVGTPIPVVSPTTANTPSSTVAPMANSSPTPTATEENIIEDAALDQYGPYPQISPADLYEHPDDYVEKKVMFTGVLISYGTNQQPDGTDAFILQVGIPDYPRPIIVLGFEPNANLGTNDGIIIGGTGGGVYYGIDHTDPDLVTPVIFGEWYECNLPVDQQEFPPEFWLPFPRTIEIVEGN